MSVYIVTYDLNAPGKNYSALYEAMEKYTRCKGLESVYFIDTNETASQVRDYLQEFVDSNDVVFVGQLVKHWASRNLPCGDWLKASGRSW